MATPKPTTPKKQGRPSTYSVDTCTKICERIATGESLRTICLDDDMPGTTAVMNWLGRHSEFAAQYARAHEAQAEFYAQEIINIADDGSNDTYIDDNGITRTDHDVVARSRLRVEARKWIASKLLPKKYGDRVQVDQTLTMRKSDELSDDELANIASGSGAGITASPQRKAQPRSIH